MWRELRLTFFGFPRLELGGAPLTFERRKSLALLAYLAATGRPHSLDALSGLLWSQSRGRHAQQALRAALADLQSALPDYVIVSQDTAAFDRTRRYWLDVEVFQDMLAVGSAAEPHPLQGAVDLCQAAFLAGLSVRNAPAFEEWLLLERARVHDLMLQALDILIAVYAQAGQLDAAIGCAKRALELEPRREEVHRQLMHLLALSGQRAAAIAQFKTCRRILARAFGVAPTTETIALYERLKLDLALLPPADWVGSLQEVAIHTGR